MKNNNIILGALILMLVGLWGCNDEDSAGLSVEPTMEIPHEGGIYNLAVQCNVPSKAVISYDTADESGWIFMLPSVLKADGLLELRIDPYPSIWKDRIATITITAGNETKTVTLTQLALPGLNLSPAVISSPGSESEATFPVSVECKSDWKATVDPEASSWCELINPSGEGGEKEHFTVKVDAMASGELRKATITVTTEDITRTVILQQGIGVEINGILWSHFNVDAPNSFAPSIDSRGLLYQYDSKVGYPNSSPEPSGTPAGYSPTGWFESVPLWREANNPCPTGWRIPTSAEIAGLIAKGYAWIEPGQSGLSIPGAVVGIPATEVALITKNNTRGGIFWPQAGYRDVFGVQENWWEANITSITRPGQNWDRHVYHINYANNLWIDEYASNARAYPVRCVKNIE